MWPAGEKDQKVGGWRLPLREGRKIRILEFLFLCCLSPHISKLPPSLCVLKAAIYRQNIVLDLKIGPLIFSFFCKFDFSYFFVFFENEQYQRRLK